MQDPVIPAGDLSRLAVQGICLTIRGNAGCCGMSGDICEIPSGLLFPRRPGNHRGPHLSPYHGHAGKDRGVFSLLPPEGGGSRRGGRALHRVVGAFSGFKKNKEKQNTDADGEKSQQEDFQGAARLSPYSCPVWGPAGIGVRFRSAGIARGRFRHTITSLFVKIQLRGNFQNVRCRPPILCFLFKPMGSPSQASGNPLGMKSGVLRTNSPR